MRTLRDFTAARVDLPLAGESLGTSALLDLRLARARARDAVHLPLEPHSLVANFRARGWSSLLLRSGARSRTEYLRRPDLGRLLDSASLLALDSVRCRIAFVVADGLSALAVHRHAFPLLDASFVRLDWRPEQERPIFIVEQGRVAIGDAIGELVGADMSIVFIGERPGMSSPDSLGVYVTWAPRKGRTDAERNCISNVHANGLAYEAAAHKLQFIVNEAHRLKLTGVALKEKAGRLEPLPAD